MRISLTRIALPSLVSFALAGCGGSGSGSVPVAATGVPTLGIFLPQPNYPGGLVRFSGTYLDGVRTVVNFQMGDQTTKVHPTSGNTTGIVVQIPNSLPFGSYSVTVTTGEGTSANADSVNVVPPPLVHQD